ncbi:MaoC family dehydratase [Halalkalibacter oceani]|uniref:MaoC family dehydratase n=1 Tax=Halalkalibacter oceani TaxID=1653776 RepID=A0A9X2IPU3_9BACI|nr:MaoC family dehydratase [Halalkalibacter oceani]MCM3715206.1 MaoC family dehydratase [Halalkalibacter oceani]
MGHTRKPFDQMEIGTTHVEMRTITEEDVNTFGRLSGDLNPLHMDEAFATKTIFQRRVVHGMFTAAIISTAHTNLTDPGYVYVGQELNFKAPVFIGDTITVTLTVVEKKPKKKILVLEAVVTNQDEKVIVEGRSALMELDDLYTRRTNS